MPVTASPTALTTLGNVKRWLGIDDEDPTRDAELQFKINAASSLITDYCLREFVSPLGTGPRNFNFGPNVGYLDFGRYNLQSITDIQIDTDTVSPTDIPATQYTLMPTEQFYGTYTGIKFYTYAIGNPIRRGAGLGRQITVTGTWGFPTVPSEVEEATIYTVGVWQRRDGEGYNQMVDPELGGALQRSVALPSQAQAMLAPLKKIV